MHSYSKRQNTFWRNQLVDHVIFMEHFLDKDASMNMEAEQLVFVAGLLARQLDKSYRRQIRPYLKNEPEEIFQTVRRHDPYFGQNAPVVFLSRANAEYLLVQGASALRRGNAHWYSHVLPGQFFGIASQYSYKAGNFMMGDICAFMQKYLPGLVEWLGGYLEFRRNIIEKEPHFSPAMWNRFGLEKNARNEFKERWAARGIDSRRLKRIPHSEFQKMIQFESKN